MHKLIAVGLAVAAAALVGAAPALGESPYDDITIHGFLRCEAAPTVHIGAGTLRSPEARSTLAHEFDHLLVAQQFGSCDEFWEWASTDRNAVLLEARGFAASAIAAYEDGRAPSLPAAIHAYSLALAYGYGLGVTEVEAYDLIEQFTERGLTVNGRHVPVPLSARWMAMLPGYRSHLGAGSLAS